MISLLFPAPFDIIQGFKGAEFNILSNRKISKLVQFLLYSTANILTRAFWILMNHKIPTKPCKHEISGSQSTNYLFFYAWLPQRS